MKRLTRTLALTAVSTAALAAAISAAEAGAFGIREQSATAQAYSFAGAASGSGGLSSTYFNPATITMKPGWNSDLSASVIIPESRVNPLPPTTLNPADPSNRGTSPLLFPLGGSGDIGQDALVPASYTSLQTSERVFLGVANSSPFGLVTKPDGLYAGQIYNRSSRIYSLNINPILGYKVTDWLSVAGGPMFQYFDVRLKRAVGLAPDAPSAILEGDDIGVGFTLGATVTPLPGTTVGVGFRSSVHHDLEGNLLTPAFSSIITAKVNTPEIVTVGVSQAITPAMNVHAGFEYTNWSRLGTSAIVSESLGRPVQDLALNYEDGFFYSVGADYALRPGLVVRAGVAYEESPITERVRSPRLPDNDRIWLSAGLGYQWSEKLALDLSYTHIFVKDTKVRIVPGQQDFTTTGAPLDLPLNFVADVDSRVDIVSLGIKYRWDNPAVAIPAPVIRKY